MDPPLHLRSGGARVAALLGACLLGATIAAVAIHVHQATPVSRATPPTNSIAPGIPADVDNPVLRLFDPKSPLLTGGSQVTIQEAADSSGRQVFLPQSSAVTDPPEVWYASDPTEVAVRYGSTLVLTFKPWAKGQDPASEYAQEAKDWQVGKTTTISGNPAWVVPKDAQAPGHPPVEEIYVAIGGWDIVLFGQMSSDDLYGVAASLAPAASPSG